MAKLPHSHPSAPGGMEVSMDVDPDFMELNSISGVPHTMVARYQSIIYAINLRMGAAGDAFINNSFSFIFQQVQRLLLSDTAYPELQ